MCRRIEERQGAPVFYEIPLDGWFFFEDRLFVKTSALTAQEVGSNEVRHFRTEHEVAW